MTATYIKYHNFRIYCGVFCSWNFGLYVMWVLESKVAISLRVHNNILAAIFKVVSY